MELRTGNILNNHKNPECKSPGFFSFLQITFYFKIEVALAKSIHASWFSQGNPK